MSEPIVVSIGPADAGRFMAKVERTGTCWLWKSTKLTNGYGLFWIVGGQGKQLLAHRVSYELFNGPIPTGLVIDHLCRNPGCVNPDHLEAVTHAENCRRGLRGRLRTHCQQGHEFTPENTRIRPSTGHRQCKTCTQERDRARLNGWERARRRKAAA